MWIEICNQIIFKRWLPSIAHSNLFSKEKLTFFYLRVRNCVTLVQPLKKAKAEMGAVLKSDRQSQVLGTGAGKDTSTSSQGWADVLAPASLCSSALQCSGERGGLLVHFWASIGTWNVALMLLQKRQFSVEKHLQQEVPEGGNIASLTQTLPFLPSTAVMCCGCMRNSSSCVS